MNNNPIKLSVAIATYNEENNIVACLKSVQNIADEIIIVDGTSQDKTVELAKSMGAKVQVVPNQKNFHLNKNLAIDSCSGAWILQLDADERLTTALASEISTIIKNDNSLAFSAYYLKRRNYFLGRWMNKGGMYPDPVIRLFQKGKAHLPAESGGDLAEEVVLARKVVVHGPLGRVGLPGDQVHTGPLESPAGEDPDRRLEDGLPFLLGQPPASRGSALPHPDRSISTPYHARGRRAIPG